MRIALAIGVALLLAPAPARADADCNALGRAFQATTDILLELVSRHADTAHPAYLKAKSNFVDATKKYHSSCAGWVSQGGWKLTIVPGTQPPVAQRPVAQTQGQAPPQK